MTAPSSSQASCSPTSRGCCPRTRSRSSTGRRKASSQITSGSASYRLQHVRGRGLPAPAARRRTAARDRPRGAARDRGPRRALRLARRVASGAHRHPRALRGGQARHGRDRLVPALREGDGARRPRRPELEAIIPARALQELARLGAGAGDTVELGVHENHVVFGIGDVWLTTRRIDGQFPNYRQLLPESFEHRADDRPQRAARRRPPDRRDRAAQLAAAAALGRGRADRVGADPGRRRGEGVVAGRLLAARSS